jgi:hypothetical protein
LEKPAAVVAAEGLAQQETSPQLTPSLRQPGVVPKPGPSPALGRSNTAGPPSVSAAGPRRPGPELGGAAVQQQQRQQQKPFKVKVDKGVDQGLGLSLVPVGEKGMRVDGVSEGGLLEGKLIKGDFIVALNGKDMRKSSKDPMGRLKKYLKAGANELVCVPNGYYDAPPPPQGVQTVTATTPAQSEPVQQQPARRSRRDQMLDKASKK